MRVMTYGIPAVVAVGALGLAACSGSSPSSKASPTRYYQEGYRYARAGISQSQYQILRHAGYARWCAGAKAATSELDNAPGGPSSEAGNQWVKGCSAYAAGDGLSASASPASGSPAGTPAPSTSAPKSVSPANGGACRTVPGYYAGGEPGHWDSQQNVCVPDGAAPENPSPQTSAQPQQPKLTAGGYSGIMPTTIGVGQDGNQITGISWSQWDSSQAVGTGQQGASIAACNIAGNDPTNSACQPVPVTITLAGVQNGQYTTITETANADSNFGPGGTSINSQYGPSVSSFIQSAS